MRQKAVANNVSNIETDDYTRREVHFEEQLREALDERSEGLARTHPRHLPHPAEARQVEPELVLDEEQDYFNGHNNVDIDREMTELSRAILSYRFSSRSVRGTFRALRLAITGQR